MAGRLGRACGYPYCPRPGAAGRTAAMYEVLLALHVAAFRVVGVSYAVQRVRAIDAAALAPVPA